MRILLSIVSLCLCVFFSNKAGADYFHHNTDLMKKIKPNLTVRSKPTSNFIKLASVQFLGGKRPELRYDCSEGWTFDSVNGGCKAEVCDGYPYAAGSKQADMCAQQDTCRSGNNVKIKCLSCKDNLVSDGKGGCKCNVTDYPYNNKDAPCPSSASFDTSNVCSEVDDEGNNITYYAGCSCSLSYWEKCEEPLVGFESGGKCRGSDGVVYYRSCVCPSNYVECDDSKQTPLGKTCIDSGGLKYERCAYCDPIDGYIFNLDKYWCSPWPNIPSVYEAYRD